MFQGHLKSTFSAGVTDSHSEFAERLFINLKIPRKLYDLDLQLGAVLNMLTILAILIGAVGAGNSSTIVPLSPNSKINH